MIDKRKRNYFKKFTNKDTNWWNVVNEIRSNKTATNINEKMCNEINDHFYNTWGEVKQPEQSAYTARTDNKTIRLETIEVLKELQKLDETKAPGLDNISARLLKSASLELAEVITHLFNCCIRTKIVSDQWKEANIAPVPKVARPSKPADYCPISLTSTMCKVMERLLAKTIINETKTIWAENQQFGFLPGKSTSDAVIQVIEDKQPTTNYQSVLSYSTSAKHSIW